MLTEAAAACISSAISWRPCRTAPVGPRDTVRTIFAQADHSWALSQLRKVVYGLRPRFPREASLLEEAAVICPVGAVVREQDDECAGRATEP